ncbi:hypothetical protein GCM10022402_47360 [Salinactinospora qingdaonensis]|uniref:Uncharacterized protein n=1 Tax=Salinactinospora qingdaonensis TaxID=702744 RepID=A0ABP7GI36_9ACTN
METGPGGDVKDLLDAPGLELIDEEAAFAFVTALPVDQLVPLVDEPCDVFLGVVIGVTNC